MEDDFGNAFSSNEEITSEPVNMFVTDESNESNAGGEYELADLEIGGEEAEEFDGEFQEEAKMNLVLPEDQLVAEKPTMEDYIQYELAGNLERQISGDFQRLTYPLKPLKMEVYHEESVTSVRTPSITTMVTKRSAPAPTADADGSVDQYRKSLIARCTELQRQRLACQIRNRLLQSQIANYYKRRKMEYCLIEYGNMDELKITYKNKLNELAAYNRKSGAQQANLNKELELLRSIHRSKENFVNKTMNELHELVTKVGHGLIYAKTGKVLTDKLIETYIHRRTIQTADLFHLRFQYISLKEQIIEKEEMLRNVSFITENLSLQKYDVLQELNKNYKSKKEELNVLLTLEKESLNEKQLIVANMREKLSNLNDDLIYLVDSHDLSTRQLVKSRKEVNTIKLDRNKYRSMIQNLKIESGLMMCPDLLSDMEISIEEQQRLKSTLTTLVTEYKKAVRQTKNVRKVMETMIQQRKQRLHENILHRTKIPRTPSLNVTVKKI
ncbi:unnamed protein product [Phyllotreta striolata]|uniref:CCDC113/CCDC96 coiled-coil domain-containing protein n=1 Tax=Phyllotreta striolata TaxID=444603 RepID=A0A9N9TDK9_PHYSR|nr:unnamed protein product [Phyllotreta striolata]